MNTLTSFKLSASPVLSRLQKKWPRIVAAFESPWVAYALLFILQMKLIWGMWAYREVTLGDTQSYYANSWLWVTAGKVNIAWSPAYTAFYGTFSLLNPDPIWATFAHRVAIVVTASLLVLAVLRQLLPPAIAWLGAAWWSVLPIVFDTKSEVHLFAVIPVLCVWLLLLTARGPWRRASAIAILGASTVLVRNELVVPFLLLGLFLLGYEFCQIRRGNVRLSRTLLAYLAMGSAAASLLLGAYKISCIKYPELEGALASKHTLNMGQVYAYGHWQRNPEWGQSPWIGYHGLMQEHFGKTEATLREMVVANPRAVGEHFTWNLSLLPTGLQLLLFNRGTGKMNPDFLDMRNRLDSSDATVLTIFLLAVWIAGFIALWRNRREWWRDWFSERALGWVGMFAVASVVPLIVCTQHPRPCYLFAFAVFLIAITGTCLHIAIAHRNLTDRFRQILPLGMIGLVLFVPRYFTEDRSEPQVIARAVKRLASHRNEIMLPDQNAILPNSSVGAYAVPTMLFLYPEDRYFYFTTLSKNFVFEFAGQLDRLQPGETFPDLCNRLRIDFFYLDEPSLVQLSKLPNSGEGGAFVEGSKAPGWKLLDSGDEPGDRWRLYKREIR
jgi:uncharacterized membrane protein YeaQ/YmgE (transglycosylase-associated protein family)